MGEYDKKTPALLSAADGSSKRKWSNRRKRHGNKPTAQPVEFQGGKDELNGNYFDCKGYEQSNQS
jgi:hypothetical protein